MDIWYQVFKGTLRIIQAVSVKKLFVRGETELPAGPKIVVGNHPNTTDSIIIPRIFSDRFHYIVYADTFKVPFWGWLLSLSGHIPIGPNRGRKALDAAKEKLAQGHSVVILPEGRMTREGEKRLVGNGATRLSLESGVPIVPLGFYTPPQYVHTLGLSNSSSIFKRGRYLFRSLSYVQVGQSWQPSDEIAGKLNARKIRAVTGNLVARIAHLVEMAKAVS